MVFKYSPTQPSVVMVVSAHTGNVLFSDEEECIPTTPSLKARCSGYTNRTGLLNVF